MSARTEDSTTASPSADSARAAEARSTQLPPGTAYNMNRHEMFSPEGGTYDIPYRALVAKGVEGMLLSGKNFACTPDFKRDLLPDNMAWGQACGVAAALCIKYGKTPRELEADSAEIQAVLKKQGAILDGVR